MSFSGWMFPTAAGLLVVGYLVKQHRRAGAMRALAQRAGFQYIGNTLPHSLTLDGTELRSVSKVWNTVDGDRHGLRIIAFDCQVGRGKGSWARTAIAIQTDRNILEETHLRSALRAERSGRWLILYEPKALFSLGPRFMPIEEIESWLNGI